MMKLLKLCILAGALIFTFVQAGFAEEAVMADQSNYTTLSGLIMDVGHDDFTMRVAGKEIEIRTDDLGLDIDADDLFTEGMHVTVRGALDKKGSRTVMEAKELISIGGALEESDTNNSYLFDNEDMGEDDFK